jgi:hypothetical protein
MQMKSEVYTGLMAKVLTYGDVGKPSFQARTPYDYLADGFDQSHIPELIRILEDDTPAVWAPAHAWRILGLLRAEEAIGPLLNLLRYVDERDDDAVQEEVPVVLAQIGPAALEPAAKYQANTENGLWARVTATRAIEEIGKEYPETRTRCIEIASQQLEQLATQSDIFNTSLIDCLIELKAVDATPVIERAFASGNVDLALRGDWEDAQIALGLIDERITPKRNYVAEAMFGGGLFGGIDENDEEEISDERGPRDVTAMRGGLVSDADSQKKKRKRKEAKKQRKAQWKRKKK